MGGFPGSQGRAIDIKNRELTCDGPAQLPSSTRAGSISIDERQAVREILTSNIHEYMSVITVIMEHC